MTVAQYLEVDERCQDWSKLPEAQGRRGQRNTDGDDPQDIRNTDSEMSTKAKITLAGTLSGAIGIIVFVHYAQKSEKAVRYQHSPYVGIATLTNNARQCMQASFVIWSSNESRRNAS